MRVLLVVGKGGVGKTTLAAASALAVARDGLRTLVVSTDPAHSLTDVLGLSDRGTSGEWRTAGVPMRVTEAPGDLSVMQIDARARMDSAWTTLRRLVGDLLGDSGLDPLAAHEVASVPGVDDILALLEVGQVAPAFDAVVIDCAPTAETLRLLALPEALDRLVARGLPLDRRIARLMGASGLATSTLEALEALDALSAQLLEVRALLTGSHASVRLVTTPERVVLAETARSRATVAMLGHHVDGVVVNRAIVGPEWPVRAVERHRAGLVSARDRFADLPVRVSAYSEEEPVGVAALLGLADAVYAGCDPLDLGAQRPGPAVATDGTRWYLDIAVPGADPDDLGVAMTPDGDLIVDLGPHRRVIALPPVLQRCEVAGASIDLTSGSQVVRVHFDPDLDLWSGALAPEAAS